LVDILIVQAVVRRWLAARFVAEKRQIQLRETEGKLLRRIEERFLPSSGVMDEIENIRRC
jgi:hypothetical protein